MESKIKYLHIAQSPCWPPYGLTVEFHDGRMLWDCDCAGGSEADVLAAAKQEYPRRKVLMWADKRHYSNRK